LRSRNVVRYLGYIFNLQDGAENIPVFHLQNDVSGTFHVNLLCPIAQW
jgi:hypothetical protein